MRFSVRGAALLVALLSCAPLTARAQAAPAPAWRSIVGEIAIHDDAGNTLPAAGATVMLYASAGGRPSGAPIAATFTDDRGNFGIFGVRLDSSAQYLVKSIDRTGQFGGNVTIGAGSDLTIAVKLSLTKLPAALHGAATSYYASRTIFFATDRAADGVSGFANDRSSPLAMTYGTVTVNVPVSGASCPSFTGVWRCSSRASDTPAFERRQTFADAPSFYAAVAAEQRASHIKRALVFIHGYNVDFSDALSAAAALDSKAPLYDGPVIAFSWPSRSFVGYYAPDLNNAELATGDLVRTLDGLLAAVGVGNVDVVAHSMGNHVLTFALRVMSVEHAAPPALFHAVVMAAPDVDRGVFDTLAPSIRPLAAQWTIYASSHDQALLVSRCINGDYYRIGTWYDHVQPVDAMQLVNVSSIDTDFIGHGYFLGSSKISEDIAGVIDDDAASRTAAQTAPGLYQIGDGAPSPIDLLKGEGEVAACDGVYRFVAKAFEKT
jgi:esterase/lipase superfamily enzyme